jgi:hypothetical protein
MVPPALQQLVADIDHVNTRLDAHAGGILAPAVTLFNTYVSAAERALYGAARAQAALMSTRWRAYHDSFDARMSSNRPQPAYSYFGDREAFKRYRDIVAYYDAHMGNLAQYRRDWVAVNIAPANRWSHFGLSANMINQQPLQIGPAFRGRIREIIRARLTVNTAWLNTVMGFGNNELRSWDIGSGFHTTLIRRIANQTWRIDVEAQRTIAITWLYNIGESALHATQEANGKNSPLNPKLYERTVNPQYSGNVLNPNFATLQTKLDARKTWIRTQINHAATQLALGLVEGWEG